MSEIKAISPLAQAALRVLEQVRRLRFCVFSGHVMPEGWKEKIIEKILSLLKKALQEAKELYDPRILPPQPTQLGFHILAVDPIQAAIQLGQHVVIAASMGELTRWDPYLPQHPEAPHLLAFNGVDEDEIRRLKVEIEIYDRLFVGFPLGSAQSPAPSTIVQAPEASGLAQPAAPTPTAPEAEPEFVFRQEGRLWHIKAFGEEGLFPPLRGLQYIADLIKSGSKRITELAASKDASETLPTNKSLAWEDQEGFSALQFRGEGIDREARQKYRQRLQEIAEELQEAQANQDLGRLEFLQEERQRILEELTAKPSDPTRKRLLKNIEKNFATAYRTLEQSMPRTAMHFRDSITRTGELFQYAPSNPPAWNR